MRTYFFNSGKKSWFGETYLQFRLRRFFIRFLIFTKKLTHCWLLEKQIDFLYIHNVFIITQTKLITKQLYTV